MMVAIMNLETGRAIGSFPVTIVDINGSQISGGEYFNEAWAAALADGLVRDDERVKYSFRLLDSE